MGRFEDYTFEVYDPSNERHLRYADELEESRLGEVPLPTMLPLGRDAMETHTTGIIVSRDDSAVAYNGIIYEYPEGIAEMGGLYVKPSERGQGLHMAVKAELFRNIKRIEHIKTIISFTNSLSMQLNLDIGFRFAAEEEVPEASFANCAGCPNVCSIRSKGLLCCDTVLIIGKDELPELPLPANPVQRS